MEVPVCKVQPRKKKKKISGYVRQALQKLILMNPHLWNQSQKDNLTQEWKNLKT